MRESWLALGGHGQFCSKKCAGMYRSKQSERIVKCLECGTEFKTQQGIINRGEGKFCSQSCGASFNNKQRANPISKEILEDLYVRQNFSMPEIAEQLECSANKVVYWMDYYGIERRNPSDATYLKRNPGGDPFKIKHIETQFDQELFTTAIALYIGEGSKNRNDISLANSDPQVIRTYLRFLREICGVEERKIRAWLNIYDDVDVENALAYWQQVTGLPRKQFGKPTVRASRGGSYLNKSEFGTLTISVDNSKLAYKINQWCKESLTKFS